jgi:hypothetical protein
MQALKFGTENKAFLTSDWQTSVLSKLEAILLLFFKQLPKKLRRETLESERF